MNTYNHLEENEIGLAYQELCNLVLEGNTCKLRAVTPDDAQSIHENANDPSVYEKRLSWKKQWYDLDDAQRFVDYANQEHQKAEKRMLGIEVDGKIVWVTSITRNKYPYNKTAYVSIRLWQSARGKWVAREAMQLISDNALSLFPDLIRLEAKIFETNKALPKILEQIGFLFEGRHEAPILYKWQILDELVYKKIVYTK